MHETERFTPAIAPLAPRSGWGPWTHELSATDAEAPELAWLGGGLSLLLWGCATLLALQAF